MLPDRDRAGRIWIDERLAAWGMAHGIQIDAISWRETTDAAGALAESVIVRAGMRERSITFADADLNQRVSSEEWAKAARRRFEILDTDQDGKLTLDALRPRLAR